MGLGRSLDARVVVRVVRGWRVRRGVAVVGCIRGVVHANLIILHQLGDGDRLGCSCLWASHSGQTHRYAFFSPSVQLVIVPKWSMLAIMLSLLGCRCKKSWHQRLKRIPGRCSRDNSVSYERVCVCMTVWSIRVIFGQVDRWSHHFLFLQMTVYLESGSKLELVSLAADRMMTNCVAFMVDFTACLCLQDSWRSQKLWIIWSWMMHSHVLACPSIQVLYFATSRSNIMSLQVCNCKNDRIWNLEGTPFYLRRIK